MTAAALATAAPGGVLPAGLLDELRFALGAERLTAAAQPLAHVARTTLDAAAAPIAIARPTSRAQVQAVVRACARTRTPLYPISGGRNWGYGDACPAADGCVLVDLAGMDRIVEVDEELAYAVIEPGVTQGQLQRHLAASGSRLVIDCTGAGPDATIVGNLLDRGFGHSRYSDRSATACAFEVVLADGEVVETGCAAAPAWRARHLYKHGIGPSLDGLLPQGNLGIVTRATIWLMPAPERSEAFVATARDAAAIAPLIDALRRLRLAGTLRSAPHCFSELRLLGGSARFPYDRLDGRASLDLADPQLHRRLLREHAVPAWAVTGVLTGSRAEVAGARAALKRELRAVPGLRTLVIGPWRLRLARTLARALARLGTLTPLRRRLEKLALVCDLLAGIPAHATLAGGHWRARGEPGADGDPRDSGSGMFWISPLLPARGDDVRALEALARGVFHAHGFEYQVTYTLVADRAAAGVMSICFDKASAEETARARRCHDRLVDALVAAGYLPYRGSPATVARLHASAPASWRAVGAIKRALDPDGIIAPGRYLPDAPGSGR